MARLPDGWDDGRTSTRHIPPPTRLEKLAAYAALVTSGAGRRVRPSVVRLAERLARECGLPSPEDVREIDHIMAGIAAEIERELDAAAVTPEPEPPTSFDDIKIAPGQVMHVGVTAVKWEEPATRTISDIDEFERVYGWRP